MADFFSTEKKLVFLGLSLVSVVATMSFPCLRFYLQEAIDEQEYEDVNVLLCKKKTTTTEMLVVSKKQNEIWESLTHDKKNCYMKEMNREQKQFEDAEDFFPLVSTDDPDRISS